MTAEQNSTMTIVGAIIDNLCGRSGFDAAFDVGDEILEDIKREMADAIDDHLSRKVSVSDKAVLSALTRIYTSGYRAGHHYTVEGGYTDVVYSDSATYFREEVSELLEDSDYAALESFAASLPVAKVPDAKSIPLSTGFSIADAHDKGYAKGWNACRKALLARGPAEVRAGIVTYEVWQDDMCQAGSTDLADARHYAMEYGQDGPVEIRKVTSYIEVLNAAPSDGEGEV